MWLMPPGSLMSPWRTSQSQSNRSIVHNVTKQWNWASFMISKQEMLDPWLASATENRVDRQQNVHSQCLCVSSLTLSIVSSQEQCLFNFSQSKFFLRKMLPLIFTRLHCCFEFWFGISTLSLGVHFVQIRILSSMTVNNAPFACLAERIHTKMCLSSKSSLIPFIVWWSFHLCAILAFFTLCAVAVNFHHLHSVIFKILQACSSKQRLLITTWKIGLFLNGSSSCKKFQKISAKSLVADMTPLFSQPSQVFEASILLNSLTKFECWLHKEFEIQFGEAI